LANVDNTSDANKPISSATQTALNAKQNSLGFTAENVANKGVPSGYASLDGSGKVPSAQLPSAVAGGMTYQGTHSCSTTAYPVGATQGQYWIASTAGTIVADGKTYAIGDWLVYNGTTWDKIDNSTGGASAVTSVDGLTGAVSLSSSYIAAADKDIDGTLAANSDTKVPSQKAVKTYADTKVPQSRTVNGQALTSNISLTKTDVGLANVDNTSDANKPISSATQTALNAKQNSLGFTAENVANKDIDGTLASNSDTKYPSQKAVKTYVDAGLGTKQNSLGFTAENAANKGAASGYAPLDASTKIPAAYMPDSVVGAMVYQTTWNCSGGAYPTVVSADKGKYWIASVAGTISGTAYKVGDWLVYDGVSWAKIDNGSAVTSVDGLTGAVKMARFISVKVVDDTTDIATGDGKVSMFIPPDLNGMNLISVFAGVSTASTSGIPTIQIRNVTDAVDMLSTKLTIDTNEKTSATAAAPAVINGAADDIATGDELAIDIDIAGTGCKGLQVILGFVTP
ncbi:hypothetical protein HGB25_00345, partial [Candidatus Saccharibacteria bacterium]|nr:hypothetical protein [Candidatus Saccharibacteria bacterium]